MSRRRLTAVLLIATISLIVTACGRKYRLDPASVGDEYAWACSRGSAAQRGNCDTSSFNGRLNLIWSRSISSKPAGPLAIHHGALILPDTRKKIRFYDVETGHHLGRIKSKGVVQTGAMVVDSLGFWGTSPRRNGFFAVNLNTSKRLWEKEVKDAQAGPIIWDNRLVVSSAEGDMFALEPDQGEAVWTFHTDQRITAAASYGHGSVFQPADRGWLYAVSADSGRELFRVRLDGPLVSPVAVADKVYATAMTGQVYALTPQTGAVVWKTDLNQPIWTSPTVSNGRVFVGHSGGEVVALECTTGQVLWRYDVGGVIRASTLAIGDHVVLGSMTGWLAVLRGNDGALVDSTTLKGAIKASPVTDGRRVLVATEAGKIYCFGEHYEQTDLAHKRINPELQSQ